MPRQRLRGHRSGLELLGRLLTLLFALALVWYGAMTLLLAFKVGPDTVNSISGYRTAFDWLSGLAPADVAGTTTRVIIAAAGVVAFLLFGWAALKSLPRPYFARHDRELTRDERGEVHVSARAFERLAEAAAGQEGAVSGARGRYGVDDLTVDVTVRRIQDLAQTLEGAQRRVVRALEEHDLPTMPVNVTLAGYDRRNRRDLR